MEAVFLSPKYSQAHYNMIILIDLCSCNMINAMYTHIKEYTHPQGHISWTDNPLKACCTLLSDMLDYDVLQVDGAVTVL